MKPAESSREVHIVTSNPTQTTTFELSNSGHLKKILRGNLYSNKLRAVIREYSSNAWDAHRSVGKNDLPIEITLPTAESPSFKVKDFGPGLSHEDVFNVFTKYGTSTKRESNEAVGMLGLGSKSGFAYGDSFTIVSRHGGIQRTYAAYLDDAHEDTLTLLNEVPISEDDTGLTIQVPIKDQDILYCCEEAGKFFQHFHPYPVIVNQTANNRERYPQVPRTSDQGFMDLGSSQSLSHYPRWTVVMGCVTYPIDHEPVIAKAIPYADMVWGTVYANIGDVDVAASREALEYTPRTVKNLTEMVQKVYQDFCEDAHKKVMDTSLTHMERRRHLHTLEKLNVNFPDTPREYNQEAQLYLTRTEALAPHSDVLATTNTSVQVRLVMEEFYKFIVSGLPAQTLKKKYVLPPKAILITSQPKYTVNPNSSVRTVMTAQGRPVYRSEEEVITAFEKILEAQSFSGLPYLTTKDLTLKVKKPRTASSTKRRWGTIYTAKPDVVRAYVSNLGSKCWAPTPADFKPDQNTVYVLFDRLSERELHTSLVSYRHDLLLAEALNVPPPPVLHAVRQSKKAAAEPFVGQPHEAWRANWLASLIQNPETHERLLTGLWRDFLYSDFYGSYRCMDMKTAFDDHLKKAEEVLPPQHRYVQFLKAAKKYCGEAFLPDLCRKLHFLPEIPGQPKTQFKELCSAYPLMRTAPYSPFDENVDNWLPYFLQMGP